MNRIKNVLIVGAGIAAISLGGVGVVSAATTNNQSTTNPDNSLVGKISSTFNLDKAKVQAVFDQNRADHLQQMKAKRSEALKQAVTDSKITQAQADYLINAWQEIDNLRGTAKPSQESIATRQAIKVKMEALRTWIKQQNINMHEIAGLKGAGYGRHHGMHVQDDAPVTSRTKTTN